MANLKGLIEANFNSHHVSKFETKAYMLLPLGVFDLMFIVSVLSQFWRSEKRIDLVGGR